jgi:hypothetical protein
MQRMSVLPNASHESPPGERQRRKACGRRQRSRRMYSVSHYLLGHSPPSASDAVEECGIGVEYVQRPAAVSAVLRRLGRASEGEVFSMPYASSDRSCGSAYALSCCGTSGAASALATRQWAAWSVRLRRDESTHSPSISHPTPTPRRTLGRNNCASLSRVRAIDLARVRDERMGA